MRTFIAIELPDAARQHVIARQRELQQALAAGAFSKLVRWTTPEKIHLTLRFLGDTSPAQAQTLTASLPQAVVGHSRFGLTIGAPGVFPNQKRPSVIWLGIAGEVAALCALQLEVERAARVAGFQADEQAYSPHLTIGRVRREATGTERQRIGQAITQAITQERTRQSVGADDPSSAGHFDVDHLVHLHSELRPGGARYTAICRVAFAAGNMTA